MHAKSRTEREQALFNKERAINSWNEPQPSMAMSLAKANPFSNTGGSFTKEFLQKQRAHTHNKQELQRRNQKECFADLSWISHTYIDFNDIDLAQSNNFRE